MDDAVVEVRSFSVEEANAIAKEQIENVLGNQLYQHNLVSDWTTAICDEITARLVKVSDAYKYIVTCVIMQKTGAGFHFANTCYWNVVTDSSCSVRWENKTIYCIVSIFAIAF